MNLALQFGSLPVATQLEAVVLWGEDTNRDWGHAWATAWDIQQSLWMDVRGPTHGHVLCFEDTPGDLRKAGGACHAFMALALHKQATVLWLERILNILATANPRGLCIYSDQGRHRSLVIASLLKYLMLPTLHIKYQSEADLWSESSSDENVRSAALPEGEQTPSLALGH